MKHKQKPKYIIALLYEAMDRITQNNSYDASVQILDRSTAAVYEYSPFVFPYRRENDLPFVSVIVAIQFLKLLSLVRLYS